MKSDQIVAAEWAVDRMVKGARLWASDETTLGNFDDAVAIMAEVRHFAICWADGDENERGEATVRLVEFLTRRGDE